MTTAELAANLRARGRTVHEHSATTAGDWADKFYGDTPRHTGTSTVEGRLQRAVLLGPAVPTEERGPCLNGDVHVPGRCPVCDALAALVTGERGAGMLRGWDETRTSSRTPTHDGRTNVPGNPVMRYLQHREPWDTLPADYPVTHPVITDGSRRRQERDAAGRLEEWSLDEMAGWDGDSEADGTDDTSEDAPEGVGGHHAVDPAALYPTPYLPYDREADREMTRRAREAVGYSAGAGGRPRGAGVRCPRCHVSHGADVLVEMTCRGCGHRWRPLLLGLLTRSERLPKRTTTHQTAGAGTVEVAFGPLTPSRTRAPWSCEVCGRWCVDLAGYDEHVRSHPVGELARALGPLNQHYPLKRHGYAKPRKPAGFDPIRVEGGPTDTETVEPVNPRDLTLHK